MQAGLGRELRLHRPDLEMWSSGYATVFSVYSAQDSSPDSEWRADLEPTTGGMVERALILGNKKPYPHMGGRPSYVLYGHFNGNYRDSWCIPVQSTSMSDGAMLRSTSTYFEQVGKVLWRADTEGNLLLEDWVVIEPPPVPPLPPVGTPRLPMPTAPAGDFPAPMATPGKRNVILKVSPAARAVDCWEATTLAAVPDAVWRFFGGSARMAREGDTTKSDQVSDATFWNWFSGLWAAVSAWVPVPNDGGAALKTAIASYLSTVPTEINGVITSGSDHIKGDAIGP